MATLFRETSIIGGLGAVAAALGLASALPPLPTGANPLLSASSFFFSAARFINYRFGSFIGLFAAKLDELWIRLVVGHSARRCFWPLAISDPGGIGVSVGGLLGLAVLSKVWGKASLTMGAAIKDATEADGLSLRRRRSGLAVG